MYFTRSRCRFLQEVGSGSKIFIYSLPVQQIVFIQLFCGAMKDTPAPYQKIFWKTVIKPLTASASFIQKP